MSGLEPLGIPGPDHLRERLTNCSDPLAEIAEFQSQNGILLPSLRPALPFLDLHGMQRVEFHQSTMEQLRDRLLTRIVTLAASDDKNKYKMLNDLLVKSFAVLKVRALQPVMLCLMQYLPKVKPEYLNAVVHDPQLYADAAVEVKQQIWKDNQTLFGKEVSPLLSRYIEHSERVLFACPPADVAAAHHMGSDGGGGSGDFFSRSPKCRRQTEVVQALSRMVGKSVRLYDMVLQFLRTLFLRTRNAHYCTLRAELLMTLHDLEVHDICSVDPCHKFTWCLDACVRERHVDAKRAKELQGFLDGVRRGQEQVLGDLSMILCDPHARNTIALSAIKALQSSMNVDGLPRANDELLLLLRMLALGLGAWNMIDSQLFKEPKLDPSLVTKFLPSLLSVMLDEQIAIVTTRIPNETFVQTDRFPSALLSSCRVSPVAATVIIYHCLHGLARRPGAEVAAGRLLELLADCHADTVFHDAVLHALVSRLAAVPTCFTHASYCGAVFDTFFMPNISRENIMRHLLRLLSLVHHRVVPARLAELKVKLTPTPQHSDAVHVAYKALMEQIQGYQASPVAEVEKLDSPLMSVPAPTPAR